MELNADRDRVNVICWHLQDQTSKLNNDCDRINVVFKEPNFGVRLIMKVTCLILSLLNSNSIKGKNLSYTQP